MPGIEKDDLERLVERGSGPCVSLYMPTARAGGDTKQNPIRLKNLLSRAEDTLVEAGLRPPEAQAILEPAVSLLDESLFWQRQSDGLALFMADGFFRGYRQPLAFEELVQVGPRFYIKPLLPLISGDGRFYVLALSQQEVRVLEGSHYSIDELELEDVPESLADALKYDDIEDEIQSHSASAPGVYGRRRAIFHGHGVGRDDEKDSILRYFRQIDQGLNEMLNGSHAPLVVAGVEFLHPIYAEANTYPYLLDDGVRGNPEPLSVAELHERAWSIVGPRFEANQAAAADRFRAQAGTGLASAGIAEVVAASAAGRVDVLFVEVGSHAWGCLDRENLDVRLDDGPTPENEDLLDVAAVRTLRLGGTVYAVERDDMPTDGAVAAVFRY